ncbi:translation initiation factor IF-2 subunit beta [archaeon]|jgi:translation initiation factor 2 subunit 2|nr:translation initiation factor IF-2 subunit beta [archaeon]MBT4241846.1 translation initiation factor IF-2 subunit beta [archaeon]MBT4418393.1 translation initiation factor IF-2 subunit beta [archaeon]
MADDYEKLLTETYKKIKPIEHSGERFEIPKIEGHFEGTKTILSNIPAIASYLRRDVDHLLRFLLKTLATSGSIKKGRVILQRKINSQKINEKVEEYTNEFVICPQCKKPDTELLKEKGFSFIHCLACGAKHSVRTKL